MIFLFGSIIVKTFSLGVYLMQLSIFYVLQTQKQQQPQQRHLRRQVNISLEEKFEDTKGVIKYL